MSSYFPVPIQEIQGEKWLILEKAVGKKAIIRATSIHLKGRVDDPSGHRMQQAKAEGSVKCTGRSFDISEFELG